jgi:hypothetical protein
MIGAVGLKEVLEILSSRIFDRLPIVLNPSANHRPLEERNVQWLREVIAVRNWRCDIETRMLKFSCLLDVIPNPILGISVLVCETVKLYRNDFRVQSILAGKYAQPPGRLNPSSCWSWSS